jgi:hypothetical protein
MEGWLSLLLTDVDRHAISRQSLGTYYVQLPNLILGQQGSKREPLQAYAVVHRRERIHAIVQTRPQSSLRSRRFQLLSAAFSEHGAKPWLRACVVSER